MSAIASLACRGFGQHRRICSLQAHALQGTNYQLKMPLGITKQGYSHCAQHPIYGTGQGSSSSPSIWTCISSILLKAHDARRGHSAVFRSPDGHFTAETNLQAFVDDTYLTTNGDAGDSCEAIIAKAQTASQDWCNLLRATGGDLEPTKSSSYLVTFGFTMTGAPVLKRFPQDTVSCVFKMPMGSLVTLSSLSAPFKPGAPLVVTSLRQANNAPHSISSERKPPR
jgi:hypothetical protein